MAADQLNKHYKVSNVIRRTSRDIQKVKRKKLTHYESNTKSTISLEWDDKKECVVVSKKEQISIARRELAPFLPLAANYQNVLGDVFAPPSELFELNDLTGLLSYEVWQTNLTVQEREFLTQFLPEGADPHRIVHGLLAGNNFYFGNSFRKWGASICSGDYHPDAIIRQEQCNKTNKVAYYSELREYHTKMIGSLQLWKETWASCMNPENVVQILPRPRWDFHKSGFSHENGLQYGPQHDLGATSGSRSWDADDKLCNSDSADQSVTYGETLTKVSRTDLGKKCKDSSGGGSVARPKNGNKLHKPNIEHGDGAKYMSYIKISKEQHEQVKSNMKQYNTNIHPKSLNDVLGNLDSLCVQPYEVFEEEERQKLHEHWLRLAKKDIPAGFENWKSWLSAKWQLGVSLRKEMEDSWKPNDEPVLNLCNNQDDEFVVVGQDEEQEQLNDKQHNGETNDVLLVAPEMLVGQNEEEEQSNDEQHVGETNDLLIVAPEDEEREQSNDEQHFGDLNDVLLDAPEDEEQEQSNGEQHIGGTNDVLLVAPEENMEQNGESVFQSQSDLNAENNEIATESSQGSDQNHHLPQISIHNNTQNFCHMSINTNNDAIIESETFSSSLVEYSENINHGNAPVGEQFIANAPLGEQFQTSSTTTEIWPPVSLPNEYYHLPASVNHDYPSISQSSFLHRRSDVGDSFYNPYVNPNRNELPLHSLVNDPGNSHYLGTRQFPRNLSSSLPLDQREENIYADGADRFLIPRQENLLPLNQVQDWPGNGGVNLAMSARPHHHLSHNQPRLSRIWFSEDEAMRDGWVGGVVPNYDIGNGGPVVDESLFSVLSGLRPGVHYSSTEFIQSGSYVGVGREPVVPTIANNRGSGVNYMSGNESELGWMNL